MRKNGLPDLAPYCRQIESTPSVVVQTGLGDGPLPARPPALDRWTPTLHSTASRVMKEGKKVLDLHGYERGIEGA